MKIIKLLPIVFFLITSFSCSSDDEIVIEEPLINLNIKSISYPQDTGSFMTDKTTYEYDESNKINKISFGGGGTVYEVNYINTNLIELNLLEENISGAEIEVKKSIYLNNNIVQNIVTNTEFITPNSNEYSRDSISYTYDNNYPSKIEYYVKVSNTNPITNNYQLIKKTQFTVNNGNIIKAITTENQVVKESIYTYDNQPHLEFGEFTYEMPLNSSFEYILIHDKLNLRNSNNIIALANSFETPFEFTPEYETINYTRILDSDNRLSEIVISGSTIATHPGWPSSSTFSNKKGTFTY